MATGAEIQVRFGSTGADGVKRDLEGVGNQVEAVEARTRKTGTTMRNFGLGFTAAFTAPIVAGFSKMVFGASDLEESVNKTNVIFGEATNTVLGFSEGSARALGFSRQAALDFTSSFAGMLLPIADSKAELSDMSTELTQLTSDFASFHNLNPDEAFTVLMSAMAGETEAIRRYGVDVSAAAVETKALELGLAATTGELTEQDKMLARYHILMEQTAEEQGDFARTSDSLANATRILRAGFADLSAEIGAVLLPAVTGLVLGMIDVVGILQDFGPGFSTAVVGFGLVAAAIGPLLIVLGSLINAFATVKAAMAGFSLVGLIAAHPIIAGLTVAIVALGAAWKTNFLGFRDITKDVFGRVTDTVGNAIDAFSDMWDSLDEGGWVLQKVETAFGAYERMVYVAGNATNTLSRFLYSLSAALASIGGDNTPAWIAAMSRGLIDLAVNVEELVGHFGDLRERGLDPVQAVLVAVGLTFDDLYDVMVQAAAVVRDLTGAFNAFIDGDFDQGFSLLGNAAETAWGIIRQGLSLAGELAQSFGSWVLDVGVPTVTGWVLDFAADAWGAVKTAAGIAFEVAADIGAWVLDTAVPTISGWVATAAGNVWNALSAAAGWVWDGVVDLGNWVLSAAVPTVTSAIGNAWAWFQETVRPWFTGVAVDLYDWILNTAVPTIQSAVANVQAFFQETVRPWFTGTIVDLYNWILEVGAPSVDLDTAAIETAIDDAVRLWEISAGIDARITEWKAILEQPSEVNTSALDDGNWFEETIPLTVDTLLTIGEIQVQDEESLFNRAGDAITVALGAYGMLRGGPVNWEIILGSPRLGGMGLLPAFLWMQANIIQPIQDKWDELTIALEWIFPDIEIDWPDFSLSLEDIPFYTTIKGVIDDIIDWFASPWGDSPLSIPAPDIDWPDPPEIPEWLKDPTGWLQGQISWPGSNGENEPADNGPWMGGGGGGGGDFEPFMGAGGGGIAGGGAALGGGLSNAFAALQRAVAAGMESVRSTISTKAAEWGTALQSGTANISSIASAAFAGLQAVATPPLVATGAVVAQQTALMMTSTSTNLGAMLANALTNFTSLNVTGTTNASQLGTNVASSLSTMATNAGSSFGTMASRAITETVRMRSGTIAEAASAAGGIVNQLVSGGSRAVSGFGGQIGRLAGTVTASGGSAISAASALGANIGSALASGLESMGYRVGQAAANLVAQANAAIAAAALISSPSRLFMQLGEYLGAGLAIGIGRMEQDVARAAAGLVPTAVDGFSVPAFSYASTAPYTAGGAVHYHTHRIEVGGITVVQQPGEDGQALAERIKREIAEERRRDLESVSGPVSIGGRR